MFWYPEPTQTCQKWGGVDNNHKHNNTGTPMAAHEDEIRSEYNINGTPTVERGGGVGGVGSGQRKTTRSTETCTSENGSAISPEGDP